MNSSASRVTPTSDANENVAMEMDDDQIPPPSVATTTDASPVESMMQGTSMDEAISPVDTERKLDYQTEISSISMVDHTQMQVGDTDEEEKTMIPPSTIMTAVSHTHGSTSIIHRLDQTTLRLCAQLLLYRQIIWFGRTCHTLYATLNHPLTWKFTCEKTVDLSRQLLSTSPTPFLQFCPCIWLIQSDDVTSSQVADAFARLTQQLLPYRLVGLDIRATDDEAKNAAASGLLQSLLKDVRMTNHLSTIEISPSISVSDEAVTHFMPRALLSTILQLPQLRSIWIQVESFTNEIAQRLSQMKQLEYLGIWSFFQLESSFLPILAAASSTLTRSLTSLCLPPMSYDEMSDFECLSCLTQSTVTEFTSPILFRV